MLTVSDWFRETDKCEGGFPTGGFSCQNSGTTLHTCPIRRIDRDDYVTVCNCCKSCFSDCVEET